MGQELSALGDQGEPAPATLSPAVRATYLGDLRAPPGNRLEALRGDRKGQHSIRINERFRVVFVWRNGNAHEVQIVDYHRR
ncbi:MAG: type II toxin-antitoxin system RelE/ParE family toxin [Bryobacteraceae bacterium]